MILSIHDFPIRYEDNCVKNRKGEILLNLKKDSKHKIIDFIEESIPAVNHGKRVFKKRLQKSFLNESLEESLKMVKEEMINNGFVLNEDTEGDVEYKVISKKDKNSKKLEFNISFSNKKQKNDRRKRFYKSRIFTTLRRYFKDFRKVQQKNF